MGLEEGCCEEVVEGEAVVGCAASERRLEALLDWLEERVGGLWGAGEAVMVVG